MYQQYVRIYNIRTVLYFIVLTEEKTISSDNCLGSEHEVLRGGLVASRLDDQVEHFALIDRIHALRKRSGH